LKKRFPEHSISNKTTDLSQEDILKTPSSNTTPISLWRKTINVSVSILGIILIAAGLSIALWISRPYITFLFSPSKIQALEKKAQLYEMFERVRRDVTKKTMKIQNRGWEEEEEAAALEKRAEIPRQVQKDWMIIPTALVDAEILEGISEKKLSLGVCHLSQSSTPGQGGNCIIEGHNLGAFSWWRPQGPFNMLEVMEKGVNIYVFYKGKKYTYKVKEKHYRDANDPKLYDFTPGERLTLITCTSSWDPTIYTNRRSVIIAYPE
jgi:LPXTG-site transpeptidase (sortase) family protein